MSCTRLREVCEWEHNTPSFEACEIKRGLWVTMRVVVRAGHHEAVEVLLDDAEAAINVVDTHRNTALHFAARMGHGRVVNALVERGADYNRRNGDGHSALGLARKHGHEHVVRTLERLGAL